MPVRHENSALCFQPVHSFADCGCPLCPIRSSASASDGISVAPREIPFARRPLPTMATAVFLGRLDPGLPLVPHVCAHFLQCLPWIEEEGSCVQRQKRLDNLLPLRPHRNDALPPGVSRFVLSLRTLIAPRPVQPDLASHVDVARP